MTAPKKKPVEVAEKPVVTAESVDSTAILLTLMEEIKQMRADREADKQQFAEELGQAKLAADNAARAAAATIVDPLRPSVLPENSIDPRTDRPGTLEEKLNCLAVLAEENGQPFDRELTRRSLLHLPVEEVNKYVFNGHSFETEAALDAYKDKIETEKVATLGKYLR
jgi:hypothetical protein